MADLIPSLPKINTVRDCKECLIYMVKKIENYNGPALDIIYNEFSIYQGNKIIFDEILKHSQSDVDARCFFKKMVRELEDMRVPSSNFDWLSDETVVNFFFFYITTYNYFEDFPSVRLVINKRPMITFPEKHNSIITKEDKIDLITIFFNTWEPSINEKLLIINEIKKAWVKSNAEFPRLFHWLNGKDIEQQNKIIERVLNNFESGKPNIRQVIPTSKNQTIHILKALFLFWPAHNDTKRVELDRIKKAYKQEKFRESVKDKKVINTYVKNEVKMMLDELAKYNERNISQEIEFLITQAWDHHMEKKL
ncbi:hypothetical protein EXT51_01175 [Pectobacterium carotovorum subsp. carotovorum]|uniref:hypothetical protein n=1 Tax=Pectobacterium TaxID=122277 RepID=UPI001BFFD370|nr:MULTISPECIES: hypothetical protein [Pectobacterium]MBT9186121.1 hypothetical protein [Pectobacterium punjabense]MCL6328128.1 hypothetical protein [Pectobacterium carotovorum subsp. carotovorum]